MMSDRPKIGFVEDFEDFDPNNWPSTSPRAEMIKSTKQANASLAEASGFRSREPKSASLPAQTQRRRRTGRNTQFNIKADPLVIERFTNIADLHGWVFGEALEKAVFLLEKEYGVDPENGKA